MSYRNVGVHSYQVGEVKYVQFISQLAKTLLIKWLGEYIGKLIIGAYTLNANVPLKALAPKIN